MKYLHNMIITQQATDVLDYVFDYSNEIAVISSVATISDAGITIVSSAINTPPTGINVRISGGIVSSSYKVGIAATSSTGEIVTMNVVFKII